MGEQGHRPARADLRAEFPGMRGLSQCSLVYMRTFAAAWGGPITRQVVAQLPWGHITVLLDKVTDHEVRQGTPPGLWSTGGPARC